MHLSFPSKLVLFPSFFLRQTPEYSPWNQFLPHFAWVPSVQSLTGGDMEVLYRLKGSLQSLGSRVMASWHSDGTSDQNYCQASQKAGLPNHWSAISLFQLFICRFTWPLTCPEDAALSMHLPTAVNQSLVYVSCLCYKYHQMQDSSLFYCRDNRDKS